VLGILRISAGADKFWDANANTTPKVIRTGRDIWSCSLCIRCHESSTFQPWSALRPRDMIHACRDSLTGV